MPSLAVKIRAYLNQSTGAAQSDPQPCLGTSAAPARRAGALLACLVAFFAASVPVQATAESSVAEGLSNAAGASQTITEYTRDRQETPNSESAAKTGATVLVLGDSISAAYGIQRSDGWVAMLSERLNANYPGSRVINASVSGETTGGGLARLPAALAADDIDLVVIELGGNDGLRGYPASTIEDNLRQMVQLSQNADAKVLLFGMQIPPNYGPRYTKAFHQSFHDVATQTGATLLPFFLEQVAINPELMQRDGIHPTAQAQPLLLDTAWPLIDAAVAGVTGGKSAPAEPTLLSLTATERETPGNQALETAP